MHCTNQLILKAIIKRMIASGAIYRNLSQGYVYFDIPHEWEQKEELPKIQANLLKIGVKLKGQIR